MIDKTVIKRMVRAMNSVLNLYDTELPDEITETLMAGVTKVATFLQLNEHAEYDKNTGELLKYLVPEDYEKWLSGTLGEQDDDVRDDIEQDD